MSFIGKYISHHNKKLYINLKDDKLKIKCGSPFINNFGLLVSDKIHIAIFNDNFDLRDIGVYIITIHKSCEKITLKSFDIDGNSSSCSFKKYRTIPSKDIKPNELYTNDLSISNKIDQSVRSTPYQELIFTINGNNVAYTTLSSTNQITTSVSENLLIQDPNVLRNDKRGALFDQAIILKQRETVEYPLYKQLLFDTNTSNKVYINLERTAITTINDQTPPYTEISSERYNKWIYYPNTVVYGLVNLNVLKIYIMQTYSNILDSNIDTNTLPLLSTKLTLPDGWIYFNTRISSETYLTNNSNGFAILVTDNFNNSYQYISRNQALFLYEHIITK